MAEPREEPPFEGGSQPVPENPPETAGRGRSAAQTVVVVVGVLILLAAILWLLVPFGAD